jgi:phosphoglycolate phosphatase-like HAD superfamily hydrolase
MCDSIIFDMDGTLVNFLKPMLASWNLTCQKYGWDKVIEYEELKSCMGLNGHDIGVRLFPGIDEDEASTVLQAIGYVLMDTELYPEDEDDYEDEYEDVYEDEYEYDYEDDYEDEDEY